MLCWDGGPNGPLVRFLANAVSHLSLAKNVFSQIQACPQCKTRYKRIKGSPRVEGDEDEDDIENELDYARNGKDPDRVENQEAHNTQLTPENHRLSRVNLY